MKKVFAFIFLFGVVSITNAQVINFPDANFKAKLLDSSSQGFTAKNLSGQYFDIDANNDNEIDVNEALQVSYLDVRGYSDGTLGSNYIMSLVGIEYFTNLIDFDCAFNQVTDLDVSSLTNLKIFRCDSNRLTNLNINGLVNLTSLAYGNNGCQFSTIICQI